MKVLAVVAAAAAVLMLLVPLVTVTALLGGVPGPNQPSSPAIPAGMLTLYVDAAAGCPGLPWSVLAAIGTVESDNGLSPAPGVRSGRNGAGAEGPMQFEPATFARYARPIPVGGATPPSPYDATDAVYAAARLLCADGAGDPARLSAAIFAYNHSTVYVQEVTGLAATLAASGDASSAVAPLDAAAWALAQIGTPYRWGGETPGVGFDCSGLVQAAWKAAGVQLPGSRPPNLPRDRCCRRRLSCRREIWCSSGRRMGRLRTWAWWSGRPRWSTRRTAARWCG